MTTDVTVNLTAIRANAAALVDFVGAHPSSEVMAVVTHDGYGHGMIPSARAALAGGATWLGVRTLGEALALRGEGIDASILAWAWTPTDDVAAAISADVDLSVGSMTQLDAVRAATDQLPDSFARIHLETPTDPGAADVLDRAAEWRKVLNAAADLQRQGRLQVFGMWSQMVASAEPGSPVNDEQMTNYQAALNEATLAGVVPSVRHLAGTEAMLNLRGTHMDLVRVGAAIYGLTTGANSQGIDLVPAMTVRTRRDDASVVLFGNGQDGGASAQDWADATGTDVRAIVTMTGARLPRSYIG